VFVEGVLMGIAIRTGSPLSLNLAEPMWKLLAGMTLTPADLTEVDRDYVPGTPYSSYQQFMYRLPYSPHTFYLNYDISYDG
jgi:hypothetical protein